MFDHLPLRVLFLQTLVCWPAGTAETRTIGTDAEATIEIEIWIVTGIETETLTETETETVEDGQVDWSVLCWTTSQVSYVVWACGERSDVLMLDPDRGRS